MKYLLLMYFDEARTQAQSREKFAETGAAFKAYYQALNDQGIFLGNHGLQPSKAANTVRIADGKMQVLNGPYPETREQLGGYFLIDVPDEVSAQAWAARCPAAALGAMEVRPVWEM